MAIDDSRFMPEAPPFARSNPQAYYAWLTSNGFPHRAAYDQTVGIFGAPKSPEEQKRDAAKQQQQAGLAQTGGAITGAIASGYILNNAGKWIDKFTGAEATPEVAKQLSSGTLSISRPVPPPTTTVDGSGAVVDMGGGSAATPQLSGEVTTIDTPVGPQQVPVEAANDPGFLQSTNWNAIGTGALSALAAYQAYRSYQSGDKIGAGISGATAASLGASALGQAGVQFAGQQTMAAAAPYLGIAAGAYGGYQTAEAMSDMAAGNQRNRAGITGGAMSGAMIGGSIGSLVPGVGTVVGAGVGAAVGAVAGAVGSLTGSSKGKGQMQRDAIRGVLQERGLLDEKFQGTLADGTLTDFGQDGSKLNTKAMNKLQSENPNAFESTQQLGDAIAASYGFVGDKARSLSRLYVRGALSNAKDDPNTAIANMQHFAKQQGITPDLLQTNLTQALEENRITQGEFNRLSSAAQQLVSGGSAGPMPQAAAIPRPEKGQVARQSAGLYRDDQGKLVRAKSMKQALKKAYDNTKTKEKK
jgi:hypothetical protein